jgi:hypothetical protein
VGRYSITVMIKIHLFGQIVGLSDECGTVMFQNFKIYSLVDSCFGNKFLMDNFLNTKKRADQNVVDLRF